MSFLIDPPWLYATGRLYGRVMPEPTTASRAVSTASTAAFLLTSVSLYLERPWTRPIWRACHATSGRDWMLNSGVLRIDARAAGRRTHLLSTLIFATYPFWLALGIRHARRARRCGR